MIPKVVPLSVALGAVELDSFTVQPDLTFSEVDRDLCLSLLAFGSSPAGAVYLLAS